MEWAELVRTEFVTGGIGTGRVCIGPNLHEIGVVSSQNTSVFFVIMAGLEMLSDQGFRIDGRRPQELRRIQCRLGVFEQADGSAYIEQGNTKVLATVYGHHEVI